jgi:hypothetical protein
MMARCVCCGCITDDDCCVDGYYFNAGNGSGGCPAGLNGPYETAAECSAAVLACHVSGPIPFCFCQSIENECCPDGVCRSFCEEELPP